uniref:Reverse transcriptase domain-containing protein n=1 Tax=Oncorhynchus kisutch TaxID=8019 RepID=A0A8C7G624_ONCKI
MMSTDSKQPIMVWVLLSDMSKAFDCGNHAKLLLHLASLGLCPRQLTWLHSYITGRTQRVMANGIYSSWTEVTSGVPQGWVVLSTQRVIFEDTLDTCYADDIWLSCDLSLDWTVENHMLLNGKKSVKLIISFSQNPSQTAPLIIGGQAVPVGKAQNNKASKRTTNSLGNNILTRQ